MARQKAAGSLSEQARASTSMTTDIKAPGLGSKGVRVWAEKVKKAGLDTDTLINRLLVEKRADDSISKCTDGSLIQCALTAASLGLTFGKQFGQAYPVAFWDSKERCFKAQLIIGYRGYIFMAKRDAGCRIEAQAIYENDEFSIDLAGGSELTHRPPMGPRGEVVGAWARGTFDDGQSIVEFMNLEELDKIREHSNGYRSAVEKGYSHPWKNWVSEMARKSAVKRLAKMIPSGGELDRAPLVDGQVGDHRGSFNPELEVIDVSVETVPEGKGTRVKKLSKKAEKAPKEAAPILSSKYDEILDGDDGAELFNKAMQTESFRGDK